MQDLIHNSTTYSAYRQLISNTSVLTTLFFLSLLCITVQFSDSLKFQFIPFIVLFSFGLFLIFLRTYIGRKYKSQSDDFRGASRTYNYFRAIAVAGTILRTAFFIWVLYEIRFLNEIVLLSLSAIIILGATGIFRLNLDLRLMQLHSLFFLPPMAIATYVFRDDSVGTLISLSLLTYFFLEYLVGKKLNEASWKDIQTRESLNNKCDELEEAKLLIEKNSLIEKTMWHDMNASISHEFKNILAIISANLESLDETIPIDNGHTFVNYALDACDRGINLANSISRAAGVFEKTPEYKKQDINKLILQNLPLWQIFLGKNIKLKSDLFVGYIPIIFDANNFMIAIGNLLGNAKDALIETEQKNAELTIKTSIKEAHSDELFAQIEIIDNGPGIDTENLIDVFFPYFTNKKNSQGTGLGLTITKNIIDEMHGTIHFEKNIDQGMNAIIQLPVINEDFIEYNVIEQRRSKIVSEMILVNNYYSLRKFQHACAPLLEKIDNIFNPDLTALSFFQDDKRFFIVEKGIGQKTGSKKQSLCSTVLFTESSMFISDICKDLRFSGHPLASFLHGYYAIPITQTDHKGIITIGTFMMAFKSVKELNDEELKIFKGIGHEFQILLNGVCQPKNQTNNPA